MNGGTIIAKAKWMLRPVGQDDPTSSTRSMAMFRMAVIFSFFRNIPSRLSPCGSPPMPKWPRNGSAVT